MANNLFPTSLHILFQELRFDIFDYLTPVDWVCFSLTCQEFHQLYQEEKSRNPSSISLTLGTIRKYSFRTFQGQELVKRECYVPLHALLQNWMWNARIGPSLVWDGEYGIDRFSRVFISYEIVQTISFTLSLTVFKPN